MSIVLDRSIYDRVKSSLMPNHVVIVFGPRRVGKTVLLTKLMQDLDGEILNWNGEDVAVRELLARESIENYRLILKGVDILVIDEAQKIERVGHKLKLIVDTIPGIKILVTGSSMFELGQNTGEPLTGRKTTINIFPLSENEYDQIEEVQQKLDRIRNRLVWGSYPELLHHQHKADHREYLLELVSSYLYKDILELDNIRGASKIADLLRLLAFQIGHEVSYNELASQLQIHKATVEKYLDLLTKVFVIYPLSGFSRNLRKEVTKSKKWFFFDNGIRNALINNFSPIDSRSDVGQLWENYAISERVKLLAYKRQNKQLHFWRTYDQQEIDLIEQFDDELDAYELKWNPRRKSKIPAAWRKHYPEASFQVVTPANFINWIHQFN